MNKTIERLLAFLRDRLTGEDMSAVEALLTDTAEDSPEPFAGMPEPGGKGYAMDSRDPVARVAGYIAAKARVESVTGRPVLAQDAAAVFREGIRALGADPGEVHPSALPALFTSYARARHGTDYGLPARPLTGKAAASFAARFPEAAQVTVR